MKIVDKFSKRSFQIIITCISYKCLENCNTSSFPVLSSVGGLYGFFLNFLSAPCESMGQNHVKSTIVCQHDSGSLSDPFWDMLKVQKI